MPFFGCYSAQFVKKDSQGNKICILGDERSTAAFQLKVDMYQRHKIEAGAWKSGAIGPDVGFIKRKVRDDFYGTVVRKKISRKGS